MAAFAIAVGTRDGWGGRSMAVFPTADDPGCHPWIEGIDLPVSLLTIARSILLPPLPTLLRRSPGLGRNPSRLNKLRDGIIEERDHLERPVSRHHHLSSDLVTGRASASGVGFGPIQI